MTISSSCTGPLNGPKTLLSGRQHTFLHFLGLGMISSPHINLKAFAPGEFPKPQKTL
jgi:hypothetical protein